MGEGLKGLAPLMLVIAIATTACGSSRTATQSPAGSVAGASTTATPLLSPGEVPQGHKASSAELDAMIRAGKKPAEAYLHLGDESSCAPQQECLSTVDAYGSIGIHAGWFHGGEG